MLSGWVWQGSTGCVPGWGAYGIQRTETFNSKRYLSDQCTEEYLKGEEPDEYNTVLSEYVFTPDGGVMCGYSCECPAPFDEEDKCRFENMFLNIKSPFGLGDIVMGEGFGRVGNLKSGIRYPFSPWYAPPNCSNIEAYLPMTLFNPVAGIVADRVNHKFVCIFSDMAMGIVAMVYAVLLYCAI